MGPVATLLPDGARLHLQHGPIDLIIGAEGQRAQAFAAAKARFASVLDELVTELPALRAPLAATTLCPSGTVARRMYKAALPFSATTFVTAMAAVAGAVADEVLSAMRAAADLRRAYVNNGGDIALHLSQGAQFTTAMQSHDGTDLGRITIHASDPFRGIATSGQHGRSLSFGIADSVTVLAQSAAAADVAATLIANAVDLPGHPAIHRRPADQVVDNSDLGPRPVVVGCDTLSREDCTQALNTGLARAESYRAAGLIDAAALHLQGHAQTTGTPLAPFQRTDLLYA